MAPKFGTSGLRGLVVELTDTLVSDYIRAFSSACALGNGVCVGWDLRASSPTIANSVIAALCDLGVPVLNVGPVPTPALAFGAAKRGMAAIMITGSHIPADRNGLKFYTPEGEISKADESKIQAARGLAAAGKTASVQSEDFLEDYIDRYVSAFGPNALKKMRIGVYQHSSVARNVMVTLVERLGGVAVPLGWSDTFIPVDTEAVDPETRTQLATWCNDHSLDALISTDGDADRPMLADATGRVVPGDVLGPLTAKALQANAIVTPVSSNTLVYQMGFSKVIPTQIGSPFVVAGIESTEGNVVGYEANGGFLLGYEATTSRGKLQPLMTRDSMLPIVAPLATANARGTSLAALVATLPKRFTAANRIVGIDSDTSRRFIENLSNTPSARAAFFECSEAETRVDTTDGLRISFGDDIVHLRPSGNAPEFRCYTEASTQSHADTLLERHLNKLTDSLSV